MLELLQMVLDCDLSAPVPQCGRLLRAARAYGWITQDQDQQLMLTGAGKAYLGSH